MFRLATEARQGKEIEQLFGMQTNKAQQGKGMPKWQIRQKMKLRTLTCANMAS